MTESTVNARDLVTRHLVRQAGRFPQLQLKPLDTSALDGRDAGLARAIDQAVMRRWTTLATVIDSCLDQDWSALQPVVQGPLLAGAAQLLLLERVPDHAIISEAVSWSKRSARPRASGLINAVLRKVAGLRADIIDTTDPARCDEIPWHDGRAMRLTSAVFDEDDLIRLSQQTSCSMPLVVRWTTLFDPDTVQRLARHALVHPPVILNGITADHPDVEPHAAPGHVVYTGRPGGLTTLLAEHPSAIVQDPTASAAVQATGQMQPRRIVDACAGRGTKTKQLARLHPEAEIIASDIDRARLDELQHALRDHPNLTICAPRDLQRFAGTADLVLLDVPCSNTGVLARRPEARHRFDRESLDGLRDLQRQIVADTLAVRAPAGSILYSTCSVDAEENEEQARWINKWHALEPTTIWSRLPQGAPGGHAADYQDGGFFCLLRPS